MLRELRQKLEGSRRAVVERIRPAQLGLGPGRRIQLQLAQSRADDVTDVIAGDEYYGAEAVTASNKERVSLYFES